MTTNNFTLEELRKIKDYIRGGTIGMKCAAMIEALKPRTVRIGNFDVPEPVREKLEGGDRYHIADPSRTCGYKIIEWDDSAADRRLLAAGQIHLPAEAAQKHNEALVSFTKLRSE